MAAAETSLREGEFQAAESHYRDALLEGWLLMGTLARVEGRPLEARDAFRRASTSAVENRPRAPGPGPRAPPAGRDRPGRGDPETPRARETRGTSRPAGCSRRRCGRRAARASRCGSWRTLRALGARRRELAFALAAGYLGAKRVDDAARLFAQIALDRPIPQTRVLIGRTYRDFGEYERARAELRTALQAGPARAPRPLLPRQRDRWRRRGGPGWRRRYRSSRRS